MIPAYNEEGAIISVIRSIKKLKLRGSIIVIDDGSIDSTAQQAKRENVKILALPFNLGIGGAVQTGLKYALRYNYDVAVQCDADGEHDASSIPSLIKALDDNTDVVIGSRFIDGRRYTGSYSRLIGIGVFSFLIRLATKRYIRDATSGFRVWNKRAVRFLVNNYPTEFPEPESIVYLLQNNFRIKEIPVTMKRRMYGRSSVTFWRALYYMVSISIAIILASLRHKSYYGKRL